jgi:orotidine-5'-phosphate decarboxylase
VAYPTKDDVHDRICWSADVPSSEILLEQVGRMPKLRRVKVDRLFIDRDGFGIVHSLRDRGLAVFDDAKISEIPTKLAGIAEVHCRHRPWMLNCMAGSATSGLTSADADEVDALKRFADVCHRFDVRPCAVTVLTSKQPRFVEREFGRTSGEQVLFYAELLLACGFTDVVCSPLDLALLRSESRFDKLEINTPGIRRSQAGTRDQARTDTPVGAFKAGASRLVIGRDLTTGDPAENLDLIVDEVLAAA